MKRLFNLYQQNPIIALIVNSIAFFAWAFAIILVVTIITVAFAN